MKLTIHAEGPAFINKADLHAVIDLLSGHEEAFRYCLDLSAKNLKIKALQFPHQKLIYVGDGSTVIQLLTEIATPIAPFAPQIFGYGWQIYKSSYDLVSVLVRYFKSEGKPMSIKIVNSPGAVVNVVNGNQVQTTPDVYESAKAVHPALKRIAALICKRHADDISIETDMHDKDHRLFFSRDNQDDFDLPIMDKTEDSEVTFQCTIYRFNKRTLKGWLEYDDEDTSQHRPFTADPRLLSECIEAFKHDTVHVTAYREIEINALGETRIKRFHVIDIKTFEMG